MNIHSFTSPPPTSLKNIMKKRKEPPSEVIDFIKISVYANLLKASPMSVYKVESWGPS